MTPEAERYLAKARPTVDHGRTMLAVKLTEDAGRAAYLAQAAQALIFQRTGKAAKTHKGAQTQFARLAVNEPQIDADLRRFLPQAYDLKAICDTNSARMPLWRTKRRKPHLKPPSASRTASPDC